MGITKNKQTSDTIVAMSKEAFPDKEISKIRELTEEMRRIYWYDILLYLTMMTEVTYREYEDDGQYQWVKPTFDKIWEIVK